ncbi:hypothetical protein [Variovorax sp. W6]|uniref:hypothetical protein n=1 Tax=Variovorax sp. W6 TaxID=3093895 RepID=UPI003D80623D
MNGWKTLVLWSLSAAFIALVAGWSAVVKWTSENSGLASWVQAVFSVLAILASAGVVLLQHRLELKRADQEAEKQTRRAAVGIVAMLQYIAAQLARTNLFANFQLDHEKNPVFYWDLAREFQTLAGTLDKLPFADVALHGQLDTYLCLRRAADELAQLYSVAPQQGDGFYRLNRTRLEDLRRICSDFQLSLAKAIQTLDPAMYEQRKEEMLRL